MIRAIVAGVGGRMGRVVSQLILEGAELELCGGVERRDHPAVGRDLGELLGGKGLGLWVESDLERIIDRGEVLIEFTSPEASLEHLEVVARHGKAAVIGTTGFNPDQLARMRSLAEKASCLWSPNMSLGVNLMYALVERAAAALGDAYDIEVIEAHHHFKVDAPSGTAIKLAEVLAGATGRSLSEAGVYGRKGQVGERKRGEIGIHAIRAGDIVGDHTVIFGGMGERLEVTHRAQSRENFARGALRAAQWIVNQGPGLYSMKDVLGF
ncbi:MAG: 4-hydroxy-tetrahydrodipicolinate reductase [Nitrospinae bacterium]|nr:4-hydroxy-tetrahydrodipicolinate reductase [Nitrospinota bacterium]